MVETVRSELSEGILTIILDDPDTRNAIGAPQYIALADELIKATEKDAIRAVVLTATGEVFSSGAARRGEAKPADGTNTSGKNKLPPVVYFLRALVNLNKPMIGAVNGPAVGLGATMLLHCDLMYVVPHVSLSFPFVDLGLSPEAASTMILPRLLGHARTAELFFLGKKLSAEEMVIFGIANEIVSDERCLSYAQSKAAIIASKPERAVQLTKKLLDRTNESYKDRMKAEAVALVELLPKP